MRIRISPDYYCSPLWSDDYQGPHDNPEILPEDLPISASLIELLWNWAYEFDAILNMDDPMSTRFASAEAEQAFVRNGLDLARRLSQELGGVFVRFRCRGIDQMISYERDE